VKAVAICGSPRFGGATETLLRAALDALGRRGIPGRLLTLRLKRVFPCSRCGRCRADGESVCALEGDDFALLFRAVRDADLVLIGIPAERGAAVPELDAFLDRAGRVALAGGRLFARKIGGPLMVMRQTASNRAAGRLITWFLAQGMVVCSPSGGSRPSGAEAVALRDDEAGASALSAFADTLAWLAAAGAADPASAPPAPP